MLVGLSLKIRWMFIRFSLDFRSVFSLGFRCIFVYVR